MATIGTTNTGQSLGPVGTSSKIFQTLHDILRRVQVMRRIPAAKRKTMTMDNGKEFSGHAQLEEQLGVRTYFAHPCASWERGTNENTNGLLRQFFPKGTDFTQVSDSEVDTVERLLNIHSQNST